MQIVGNLPFKRHPRSAGQKRADIGRFAPVVLIRRAKSLGYNAIGLSRKQTGEDFYRLPCKRLSDGAEGDLCLWYRNEGWGHVFRKKG